MRNTLFALSFSALAAPAAGAITLSLPVECELGTICYIQQYMDHDPSKASQDFQCGPRTYNTHKGTDFAVATAAKAKAGINIIAAATGTVLGTRNNMPDVWTGEINPDAIEGRDCGNGLVIDHGDGWQTQYCHLREGSVVVKKGEMVEIGTKLGEMGMSGRTQFAHLHLSVRKDGQPVDPFAPDGPDCNAPISETLWDDIPLFQKGGILDVGFSNDIPDFTEIKLGVARTELNRTSPALVSYFYLFGAKRGDTVEMTFKGPGDFLITDTYELPKNRAQFFRAIGKIDDPRHGPAACIKQTLYFCEMVKSSMQAKAGLKF
jgi:hypothetical protein